MFQALYIEEEIREHPKVLALLEKFSHLPRIFCERYGEVFNRKGQNFRLQKEGFSLILAKKHDNFLLKIPSGYGISNEQNVENYYFSHMLNCMYDCRYCFLQGMYRSAHIVLFVNYEDFAEAIVTKVRTTSANTFYFFSGYDGDSLALDHISGFSSYFLSIFSQLSNAYLELRTKSVNIFSLLNREPIKNCVVAFSLSPQEIVKAQEHKTPSLEKRLEAAQKLSQKGYLLGLRFDPLIYFPDFKKIYTAFFTEIFTKIPLFSIHSISLGPFRLPIHIFKNMLSLYPEEKLFSFGLEKQGNLMSYKKTRADEIVSFCKEEILKYAPKNLIYPVI